MSSKVSLNCDAGLNLLQLLASHKTSEVTLNIIGSLTLIANIELGLKLFYLFRKRAIDD